MKRIHYLTIALTIVGLAFYAGRMTGDSPSRDEAQQQATPPASCAPTPERKLQFTPGNPANTAHIANTDPAKAVSAQPVNRQGVSTDGMQDDHQPAIADLPENEQQSLWKAFDEARREVREIPSTHAERPENAGYRYYASNSRQNLTMRYGAGVIRFASGSKTYTEADQEQATTAWEARMRLLCYAGNPVPVSTMPAKSEEMGSRVEFHHQAGLSEWYVNGRSGIEHGYTISAHPAHLADGQEVTLQVALEGLQAVCRDQEDGTSELVIPLPSPITAFDGEESDKFGAAVAMDGNIALIGAPTDDKKRGSAHVFRREADGWKSVARLQGQDCVEGDRFGYSVALSGPVAVVGAFHRNEERGAVFLYYQNAGGEDKWGPVGMIELEEAVPLDKFGYSLAASGRTVVAGAPGPGPEDKRTKGSVYVLEARKGPDSWAITAVLEAPDGAVHDRFGAALDLDGDSLLVGADGNDNENGVDAGAAYAFERRDGKWKLRQKFIAPGGDNNDRFGLSVAVRGDAAVVGAPYDEPKGMQSGSAYTLRRTAVKWEFLSQLVDGRGADEDHFGEKVATDGKTIVVGAPFHNSVEERAGAAIVFRKTVTGWQGTGRLVAADPAKAAYFGHAVAVSGNAALIGAPQSNHKGPLSGAAYFFDGKNP